MSATPIRWLVAVALAATTFLAAPADAAVHHVRLGGVDVRLRDGTTQVVTVNRTHGYHAHVSLWRRSGGHWVRTLYTTGGRIGYGGLVEATRRRQGTGTTPIGTFTLPSAFGRHARSASWHLPYRRIHRGDFWVEDNGSRFYNRYRNQAQGGFRWWLPASNVNSSERLGDYPTQYEWSIVVGFNLGQVRHRGAGIFLHVNGRGATAGCVSAPRSVIRTLMARLDPRRHPVIAIGR